MQENFKVISKDIWDGYMGLIKTEDLLHLSF